MSGQPTFVTFEAHPTDDAEFSSSGDIIVPAGRELSRTLTKSLELRGFKVAEWGQYEFYGWQTTVEMDDQKCWILFQGGERWLLIAERRNGFLGWARRAEGAFRSLFAEIDAALKSDSRFDNISWFTRAEYESGSKVVRSAP